MTVRKIESGRIITVQAVDWVGPIGTIFYEETTGDLRLGDGVTPGGILLYPGGGGSGGGTGYAGSRGFVGSRGYTGSAGIDGIAGFVGSQGAAGTNGFTGSTGAIGYIGSRGQDGISGYSGSAGYTGSSGIGYVGSAGINGYTGSSGINGYTGSIGYAGSAGSTYLSGLLDVDLISTPPLDTQVLAFSTATNKWIPNNIGSLAIPVATTSTLGGIKVGANLSITPDGVLSASASGYSNLDGGYPFSMFGGTLGVDGGTP